MVTFIPAGRMGNYLYELATVIGYSLEYGLDFTAPFHTSNDFWSPIYLKHLQNENYNPHLDKIDIWETTHAYEPIPFDESWREKNIFIHGYRQTAKYFEKYRKEILYLFDMPYHKKNVISLHARFGDYLTIEKNGIKKHILVDEDYITKAIKLVSDKTGITEVKVFSDNIPYFKEKFGSLYNFQYSTNANEYEDMVEISCCHSQINSSSTFSWWGAWLNRNEDKVIVTQKDWFTPNWDNLDVKDIIPENWIKL